MGDRNNPIKFGPEWLRNLPGERTAAGSSNSQNANSSPGTSASGGPSGASASGATGTNSATTPTSNSNNPSKVLLAKLRYGREEMLALYDRNSEAPSELKFIDTLYHPRGKQPVALNNLFEDDVRDNLRSAPPIGGMPSGDRFLGRGGGRGASNDGRGRTRGCYLRQASLGRGALWHAGGLRMPNYSGGADDESGPSRPWTNNNLNNTNRNTNSGEQTDWASKTFRSKRQGTNTNWRQPPAREEGEEWRSSEPGRSRQDRDWPPNDRPQSWSAYRRNLSGAENNEENLPEWAVENAECGGTFDSSGAFHGYSNDDSNLPKQEGAYSLTRSHTHGSFTRPKLLEEGSDEWWASEKAKKLSPKRFDANDHKLIVISKKPLSIGIADGASTSKSNKSNLNTDNLQMIPEKLGAQSAARPDSPEAGATSQEEATDDRGNFQSVIINSNNSLRQKHQHLVPAMNEASVKPMPKKTGSMNKIQPQVDHGAHASPEELLVDNIFGMSLDDTELLSTTSSNSMMSSGMSPGLASVSNMIPINQNQQMNMPNTQPSQGMNMEMHLGNQNKQTSVVPPVHHSPGMQPTNAGGISSGMQPGLHMPGMPVAMQTGFQSVPMQNMPAMPSGGMQSMPGMASGGLPNIQGIQDPRIQTPGIQPVLQNVGITNSALNASLGLPIGPNIGQPFQGMRQQVMSNVGNGSPMGSSGMGVMGSGSMQGSGNMQGNMQANMQGNMQANMQGNMQANMQGNMQANMQGNMSGFQSGNALPGTSNNVGNASLFLAQNNNTSQQMPSGNDMPMSNHSGQNNMMNQLHGLQGSQAPFGNSMYGNNSNLFDLWYYEDPERNIQGPFTSKDMYSWYRAGFFSPRLMVRRACETMMRPLGTYGPVVPFAQVEMLNSYPMSGGYDRPQPTHENMLNSQGTLGLDVMNMGSMNVPDNAPMEFQFGSVGIMANQTYGQPQEMVNSLWGQASSSNADLMWMQPAHTRTVNNLPMFFWDQQPSAINSNSLLPDEIAKEMKTEDQILAHLRASQNIGQASQPFMSDLPPPPAATSVPDDYPPNVSATPNMEELQKLIQKETLTGQAAAAPVPEPDNADVQPVAEKPVKLEQSSSETSVAKSASATKTTAEPKQVKQTKEADKSTKNKENNNTKNKNKKAKEDKKEEAPEVKAKEEETAKPEKRSQEQSPSKNKKEDKTSKKDIEKEKKEWIKEGFTIVKGPEKSSNKDTKKKAEEARVADEAEKKRKEEEKLATDEEKKKKQAETVKKLQEQQQAQQQAQQRQASESVVKKAPWSTVATQNMQATSKDGLTLAEIQRLEREKKLEQMKEQQQMMQIIAQQQAAALAREQEMQAGLGWAKKKGINQTTGQSLAEIQAEARKQAMAAAVAAAAKAIEESESAPAPQTNHAPWANTHNGGGFWDTQPNASKSDKTPEPQKAEPGKNKKKLNVAMPVKKDTSPAVEFDAWCAGVLNSWSSKIDVPTFVGFLKDIESPYEVKDYVKCYLGESKESSDFARQFLERRSKLLRVGMVTPSDDLCSPAMAVNPRTTSGSDYQEVKGKGKKTKKNKMLKVDVRILGFSVTAAEDRINVGDIDTV